MPAVLTVMQPGVEPVCDVDQPITSHISMSHHLELLNREIQGALASVSCYIQRSAADQRAKVV